jgi:ubiquitin carboxyl-terminal hydrolase 4/11/15
LKQIIDAYDNHQDSQDEETGDSGEDQGLDGNTFQSGSSSALTGAGAAHRRPNLGSASAGMTTVSPARLESLPAYKSHEENDEDAAPLLADDAMMNDGIPMNSIEEDEGISMDDDGMGFNNMNYNTIGSAGPTNYNMSQWNFNALANGRGQVSGTGSDEMDDGASDKVNMNSSASDASREDRLRDFDDSVPMEDGVPFEDQCPVPDASDEQQATIIDMHHTLAEHRLIGEKGLGPFHVESGVDDDDEEPAAEIHVDDEPWKTE